MKALITALLLAVSVSATPLVMSYDNGIPYAWVEFSETNQAMANDFTLWDFTHEIDRYQRISYVKVYADLKDCGFNVNLMFENGEESGFREMIRYGGSRWYMVYFGYKIPDPHVNFKVVLEPINGPDNTPKIYVDSHYETFWRHSWQYNGTSWRYLVGVEESGRRYRNLMIRVLVRDKYPDTGVEPTSLGRIKALY